MHRSHAVEDVKFEGEKVVSMQFAFFSNYQKLLSECQFHTLWGSHCAKVVQHKEIYLNVSGFSGAFKYVDQERWECHGLPVLISAHCHVKYLPVAIVVHRCQHIVVVQHQVLSHDTLPLRCNHWTYMTTGNYPKVKKGGLGTWEGCYPRASCAL